MLSNARPSRPTCCCWRRRWSRSKLASLHVLEIFPARGAKFTQQVDGAVVRHLTQFGKALVGLKIRVQDLSGDGFSVIHYRLGGQDTHPAELRIETYQTRNISLIVLECVDVALADLFDKVAIGPADGSSRAATIGREPEFGGLANLQGRLSGRQRLCRPTQLPQK